MICTFATSTDFTWWLSCGCQLARLNHPGNARCATGRVSRAGMESVDADQRAAPLRRTSKGAVRCKGAREIVRALREKRDLVG